MPDANRTEREKMVAGDPYDAYDPELVQARRRARRLCRSLETSDDETERRSLLRSLLLACPDTTEIVGDFHCDYGWNVSFAPHCFVNFGCVILDVCPVAIGEYTLLGPSVHIYTAAHPLDAGERRLREFGRPVTIGNDVWLGGGVIVCPGVAIGDRSVIGAGSVVTRDIPADCVAAGNPCRIVRKLESRMF